MLSKNLIINSMSWLSFQLHLKHFSKFVALYTSNLSKSFTQYHHIEIMGSSTRSNEPLNLNEHLPILDLSPFFPSQFLRMMRKSTLQMVLEPFLLFVFPTWMKFQVKPCNHYLVYWMMYLSSWFCLKWVQQWWVIGERSTSWDDCHKLWRFW